MMPLSYKGRAKEILEAAEASDYDLIRISTEDRFFEGLLMPRPEILDDEHIVLKLANGYNIGIHVSRISSIEVLKKAKGPSKAQLPRVESRPGLPKVPIVVTGGTIASRVDYSTGAVKPTETPEELIDLIPEIAEIANVSYVPLMTKLSEDIRPEEWGQIAQKVADELNAGASGVVVAHGTDTMHYTASALAFMLENLDRPVVLVGSQRSIDRPSTDAVLNVMAAVRVAAEGPMAESVIVMHGSSSDDFAWVIRGVRARKMHTSRRDAFMSVNELPLAKVDEKGVTVINPKFRRRSEEPGVVTARTEIEPKVALAYSWPGIDPEFLEAVASAGYKGIVLAGTGLGHVPNRVIGAIRSLVDSGVPVVITSQCLFGRVDLKVYSTGRNMLEAGVIPAADTLPEVATVKLMIALGRGLEGSELREFMTTSQAGEFTESISPSAYPPCFDKR